MICLVERGLEVVLCEGGGDVQEDLCCQWLKFPPGHEWDAVGSSGRVVSVVDGEFYVFAGNHPFVVRSWQGWVFLLCLLVRSRVSMRFVRHW